MSASNASVVLSVSGIGKTYTQPVLTGIDLKLYRSEVLALTGENGAGKSTLSKVIGGLELPTLGQMKFNGQPYAPNSRSQAERQGVRMVMQELNLLPTLTVAENLFMDNLPGYLGWINRKQLRRAAIEAMAQVGLEAVDPDTLVADLGIGHQQMVEIARNLIGDCHVLILDEPTAMLTAREVEMLFAQIERLQARGVAIIYISHRLEELARVAQRIAILRDGCLVRVEPIVNYTSEQLVHLMVGRELADPLELGSRELREPALKVTALTRSDKVRDVSFEVRKGEIFGISGLIGAGRTELLRLIYGADLPDSGTVAVGSPLMVTGIRSPADAVRQGIALITEDRKSEGLLLTQSISANISLGNMHQVSSLGMVSGAQEAALAQRQIDAMGIRSSGPEQVVSQLSGGNQQKVVIGRWLERDCAVLLFDEPTRGIDIGAKFDIYRLFGELTRQGRALVVVSSDLRELMLICDRIGVLSAGRLIETFERNNWSQEQLLAAAFAGYQTRDALLAEAAPKEAP